MQPKNVFKLSTIFAENQRPCVRHITETVSPIHISGGGRRIGNTEYARSEYSIFHL